MAANPYVQGWRESDERYADLVLGRRNWQIAAAGSIAVSSILAGGWGHSSATIPRKASLLNRIDALRYE
jgi:type IV secretory pathway TrbF-like protein